TRSKRDWSSDVCSSDLWDLEVAPPQSPQNSWCIWSTRGQRRGRRRHRPRLLAPPGPSGRARDTVWRPAVEPRLVKRDVAQREGRSEERRVGKGGRGRG